MLEKIKQFIKRVTGQAPEQNDIFVQKLMQMLINMHEEEMPCEDVFEVMDLYAEAVNHGEDVSQIMPLVERHLIVCGVCREQFEMLLDMVKYEQEIASGAS
jgi:hypothetical protein